MITIEVNSRVIIKALIIENEEDKETVKRIIQINPSKEWMEQRKKRITPVITDDCLLIHSPNKLS